MPVIRKLLLAVLTFGLVGSAVELTLLQHYEGAWQAIPLWLIAASLAVVAWQWVRPTRGGLRALRLVMAACVVSGALGVVLHYRGNLEYQLESDPTQSHAELFWKVMRAKAPPALAPGLMMQLGFLGLIYAYRHPASTADMRGPAEHGG